MIDKRLKIEIDELLYLMLEDAASDEQVKRLNCLMDGDSDVRQYVADYYFLAAALRKTNSIALASLGTKDEINELHNLLDEMAQDERTAPSVEIVPSRPVPEKVIVEKYPAVRAKRTINPYSLAMTITSLAALFVMIAYFNIVPPKESVAMLHDSIGAQWQGGSESIESGTLFYNTDEPRVLKKGIAEIEFDYGASVVIEGPSEFVCKADNQIVLTYGRLYARVPSRAIGFTVETRNSRVVDLGTEFGVQVNVDGTTELHVHKGITKLLAGNMEDTEAFTVSEGQAREVSANGEQVKEVRLQENGFIQQISSKTNLIRKGQATVDLADIVGGGNGFGTGRRNVSIDPVTGELTEIFYEDRFSDNAYRGVESNPFIDGVFVPNSANASQIVSSLGDVFDECPATQENFYLGVTTGISVLNGRPIVLNNVDYGRSDRNSIFMHTNLGVTYDLNAIRSQLADIRITRFQSTVGLCNSSWRDSNADFWVLVDGKVRYRKENVQQKGIVDFLDIELSDDDRFLTLITTDGGDPKEQRASDGMLLYSIQSDWCLFAEPVLMLE